jgi:hypothetical protein
LAFTFGGRLHRNFPAAKRSVANATMNNCVVFCTLFYVVVWDENEALGYRPKRRIVAAPGCMRRGQVLPCWLIARLTYKQASQPASSCVALKVRPPLSPARTFVDSTGRPKLLFSLLRSRRLGPSAPRK